MRNLQQLQAAAGLSQQGSTDPLKPVFIKAGVKKDLPNTASEPEIRKEFNPAQNLAIGQVHINRLKRYYCENLDRQKNELTHKLSLVPKDIAEVYPEFSKQRTRPMTLVKRRKLSERKFN